MASALMAASRWSSRRSALREALSGPWQAKQCSERIGRTSRLYSSLSSARPGAEASSRARATAAASIAVRFSTDHRGSPPPGLRAARATGARVCSDFFASPRGAAPVAGGRAMCRDIAAVADLRSPASRPSTIARCSRGFLGEPVVVVPRFLVVLPGGVAEGPEEGLQAGQFADEEAITAGGGDRVVQAAVEDACLGDEPGAEGRFDLHLTLEAVGDRRAGRALRSARRRFGPPRIRGPGGPGRPRGRPWPRPAGRPPPGSAGGRRSRSPGGRSGPLGSACD